MVANINRLIKNFSSPKQVQRFLRAMDYNRELRGETLRSALEAVRAKMAHCFEATFIAAAILEHHGFPPILLSLESKDGIDHVLFLFCQKGKWGAITRSRDEGLHGRAPAYKSIEHLAWSYYDSYVDKTGELTGYQVVHMDELPGDWRQGKKNLWAAERFLIALKHRPLRASKKRYNKLFKNYCANGPLTRGKNWW